MKIVLCLNIFVITVLSLGHVPAAAQEDAADAEKQIRAAAESFQQAFNRRDAKAVAAHWSTDGVYTNEEGDRFEGRESIEKEYQSLFESDPDVRLQMEIDAIRLINPQTAIEEGRAALVPQPPGETRVMSSYTAVHVKQDGKWIMTDVRDTYVELPPDTGDLDDLEWLVGSWTAGQKAQIEVKCRWMENQHFLARSHTVTESGKVTSGGLEIIGVDPSTGLITSWNFDNQGGHAMGIWSPHDKGWMIEYDGVLADGTPTYAINILSRVDDNTLSWKSQDRFVDEKGIPDLADVLLKRK